MRRVKLVALLTLILSLAALPITAAEKYTEKPDPEMLRIMEVLREWDMLKNMQLFKEMPRVGQDAPLAGAVQTPVPTKPKEGIK